MDCIVRRSFVVFKERNSAAAEGSMDYIVTGAVDGLVKVWTFKNDCLELKHKLEGHSLGVVSVAINSDSTKTLLCSVLQGVDERLQ
ncbi:WD repeat-containing protein 61-like isoform X3 [Cryptotermes secundus]|uniref:WD repeat-containing protein 61-like isoform X3 n=1 Tax=Cryptotermes secundus TaxID=105785 RepID=UPI000CD7D69B|nr:WD repeat-containing protein 61-like isoform X3 [Cryptotermes secundus]